MYTIKQASLRTGVSVPLLRAWERRYGIPTPERTSSGYRLYGEDAIAQLRSMRTLVDDGWAPSQAAVEVLAGRAPRPEAIDAAAAAAPAIPARDGGFVGAVIARIVAAAAVLDEATIEAGLSEATIGLDFESAIEKVWLPALVSVGEAWAAGDLDVASEHALSAAVLRRLGVAYEAAARSSSRAQVLVGLPPGARHELGALAFAVAARRGGLDVLYLGPDVPVESWTRAVAETGARAVVLGLVADRDRDTARAVLTALASVDAPPALLLGGPAAVNRSDLGGSVLPVSLRDAVEAVRQALPSAG